MNHRLLVLGSGGAIPDLQRNTASYLLLSESCNILFDCGEATQHQLLKYGQNKNRIGHICISHLHGDHIFGLIGLLASMSMSGRTQSLQIYGPTGIESFIKHQFSFTEFHASFHIQFIELHHLSKTLIFDSKLFSIYCFPLKHRIPTYGYLYETKNDILNIKKEAIAKFDLSVEEIKKLKKGQKLFRNNVEILQDELLYKKSATTSFAYCSDTIYDLSLAEYFCNVDLLFHEATFLNIDQNHAESKMHATALQAANIAKITHTKQLLLGHISARYKDFQLLLNEAKIEFDATILAIDGQILDF